MGHGTWRFFGDRNVGWAGFDDVLNDSFQRAMGKEEERESDYFVVYHAYYGMCVYVCV